MHLSDDEFNEAMHALIAALPDHKLTGEEAGRGVNSILMAVERRKARMLFGNSTEVKRVCALVGIPKGMGVGGPNFPWRLVLRLVEDMRNMPEVEFCEHVKQFRVPSNERARTRWYALYNLKYKE